MRLSKLGIGLMAVLAIAAVTASSAFAGTVTQASTWKVGEAGTALKSGESRAAKCHLEEEGAGGKAKLNAQAFGGLIQVELTATGIECVEATINQTTVGGVAMAEDAGKIRFTGVSVMEPAECTVPSTLTTNKLKTKIEMHSGSGAEGEIVFDRFEPETGNVFIEIPFSNCAIAGNQPVEGSVYGQSGLKTGQLSAQQTLTFSSAVNTTAGGTLQFAGEPASLTANVINELTTGVPFGVN